MRSFWSHEAPTARGMRRLQLPPGLSTASACWKKGSTMREGSPDRSWPSMLSVKSTSPSVE